MTRPILALAGRGREEASGEGPEPDRSAEGRSSSGPLVRGPRAGSHRGGEEDLFRLAIAGEVVTFERLGEKFGSRWKPGRLGARAKGMVDLALPSSRAL